MIFTSVFGFANSPSAYYLMGYSAIPFYIFSALLFFIPFALMMAEMGAAYRKEEGGIYSWMNNSVGPRFAFIGTFMWFSSYIIWMVSTSAKVWVPFSTFLYGSDMTQHWHIAGLEPTQVVGLLAVAWMILVTVVASKGINKNCPHYCGGRYCSNVSEFSIAVSKHYYFVIKWWAFRAGY